MKEIIGNKVNPNLFTKHKRVINWKKTYKKFCSEYIVTATFVEVFVISLVLSGIIYGLCCLPSDVLNVLYTIFLTIIVIGIPTVFIISAIIKIRKSIEYK